jgi:hypothetical protein
LIQEKSGVAGDEEINRTGSSGENAAENAAHAPSGGGRDTDGIRFRSFSDGGVAGSQEFVETVRRLRALRLGVLGATSEAADRADTPTEA